MIYILLWLLGAPLTIILILFTIFAVVNVWLALAILVLGGLGFQSYIAARTGTTG